MNSTACHEPETTASKAAYNSRQYPGHTKSDQSSLSLFGKLKFFFLFDQGIITVWYSLC